MMSSRSTASYDSSFLGRKAKDEQGGLTVLNRTILGLLFLVLFGGLAMAKTETVYIPQIGYGDGFETTFSFMNFSATTNRVEIRAFSPEGDPAELLRRAGSPFEDESAAAVIGVEVAGFGSAVAQTLSDSFQLGYAEIDSDFDEDFGIELVFRRFSGSRLITSTSILPLPASTAFSFLAFSDSFARTGLALVNPKENESEAEVTMLLYDNLGLLRGTAEVTLQSGHRFSQFIDESTPAADLFPEIAGEEFSGTIEVRSDVPVAVAILRTEGAEFLFTTQTVQQARDVD
jgi:hypothetical protein